VKEREREREKKKGLSALINYLCILIYHKSKLEFIELGVVKVVLHPFQNECRFSQLHTY